LRRVPDVLPLSVWLVTAIEACDKFAFFGLAGPLQNYLQNPRDDPLRPGAIGLGQAYATAANQAFTLWCFVTPILGAIVADQRLGRLRTILYASSFYLVGLLVVFITSFPAFDCHVTALGLLVGMLLIGIGTGGIRPNVNSLVAEQYTVTNPFRRTLESGESVIVDPKLTVQRIFLTFLFCVNAGSLSAVATTSMEHKYGFSAAFALPTIAFAVGLCIVRFTKNVYQVSPPRGSVIIQAARVLWIAFRNHWDFESAKGQSQSGSVDALERHVEWDDDFVDEVHQAARASQLFVYFPFFWTAYSQMLTNFVSQAGTMETHGIPNDILTMINPLFIMAFIPILDRIVFPWLRK
ncbi:POT family-domain-containing protein, partial [Pyrenochaeta sp. MPI-SDFR-AT-0127]